MPLAKDLLHPTPAEEKRKCKLKRLVQHPNSYFMDVKCPGCYKISTVFSHAQTVVACVGCATVLCQPTGGKAKLTDEYWKSNPRKFCDFCKCWIADNKPSIEFHERGKKHKENVQKRLDEIGKKGKEDYENKLKENDYLKEMERAALKAYQKDIEQNPDFTGSRISAIAEASNAKIVVGNTPVEKTEKSKEKKKKPPKQNAKWQEAKTPEGFSYYWNTETKESVWEAPKEGFISLKDQEKQENPERKSKKKSTTKKNPEMKEQIGETPPPTKTTTTYGPVNKVDPYGTWESAHTPVEEVDLQLPSLPEEEYQVPELIIKKPEIKFKEKVVTLSTSASKESISFKKRKGGDDLKKNVRRRVDD